MGEQPLPPYGACLLGSLNLTRYVLWDNGKVFFNWRQLYLDLPHIVRAMDNVIDETDYPLEEQEKEAKNKRRMGLGITGLANVLSALGMRYGSKEAQRWTKDFMRVYANRLYTESALLAKEKGSFPLFEPEKYLQSKFIQSLEPSVQDLISSHGIRNSHLVSIAPTGTISLYANNVSSGLEPVFAHKYSRKVLQEDGSFREEEVTDYAYREWGITPVSADSITVQEHVGMLNAAQEYVDSACSKTCNVGDDVTFDEFREVYMMAYDGGAKGCTTFRSAGFRAGILTANKDEDIVEEDQGESLDIIEGAACTFDEMGNRTCDGV